MRKQTIRIDGSRCAPSGTYHRAWIAKIAWAFLLSLIASGSPAQATDVWASAERLWAEFGKSEDAQLFSLVSEVPGFVGYSICGDKRDEYTILVETARAVEELNFRLSEAKAPTRRIIPVGRFEFLAGEDAGNRNAACTIGVATEHPGSMESGTVGCRVKDSDGQLFILSNRHVYYGAKNDEVVHPGLATRCLPDGRYSSAIGKLERWTPLDDTEEVRQGEIPNTVDAAIAFSAEACMSRGTPAGGYGVPTSRTMGLEAVRAMVESRQSLPVRKHGQKTGSTSGEVLCVAPLVLVEGMWFSGQIIIEDRGEPFSQPGDSGSLVVAGKEREDPVPVGLLFARSTEGPFSLANPIDEVLCCLEVRIDGSGRAGEIPDRDQCVCNRAMRNEAGTAEARISEPPAIELPSKTEAGPARPGRPTASEVLAEHADTLLAIQGVVGVARGVCEGRPCIRVFIDEDVADLTRKIPSTLDGYPVRVLRTGEFEFLSDD